MKEKIHFGVIGAGAIARLSHVPAIKKIPEAQLVAICRRTKKEADRLAKIWKVEEVYYSYEDLGRSPNVDAVIVATPPAYHMAGTVAAAREGKHVFCEKPMATKLKRSKVDGESLQ